MTVNVHRWSASGIAAVCVVLVLLASCSRGPSLRYMDPERAIDPEWGYPGSQARIDVTGRIAASATLSLDEELGLLRTVVTLTNVEEQEIRLLVGGCPVQIQVFGNEELEGAPVWDSFRAQGPCAAGGRPRRLDSLEDYHIPVLLHQTSILQDSLPSGQYYFNALIRANGIRMDLPAGSALLFRE